MNRRGARCIVCGQPVPFDHVRAEGRAGRMGTQLMAIVTERQRGRQYNPPTPEQEAIARSAQPEWAPDTELPERALSFRVQLYGMTKHRDLFSPRQLAVLSNLSNLVGEARQLVNSRPLAGGTSEHDRGARADAVATYLAFALDKAIDRNTSLCTWENGMDRMRGTFGRQALPMIWDYAEANPFAGASGDFQGTTESLCEVLDSLPVGNSAHVSQRDATARLDGTASPLISTDPPYYDNIGYADLSDFFCVWLRYSLKELYPETFSTLLVPKTQELVATPFRFGGSKQKAQQFFEKGLGTAFSRMRQSQNANYPLSVYYAFKQAESDEADDDQLGATTIASTGWETMLEGLMRAGFSITGTWPMHSELSHRIVGPGANALASSIVLVCRPRPDSSPLATRREFVAALKKELLDALIKLTHGGIAPVDLAQASIGPGMAVFSRYAKVLEADGTPMSVRTALQIVNQELDEYLTAEEGDVDRETRFALAWY